MHKIKVKKLHDDAEMPAYATDGSACFDLAAISFATVKVFESAVFKTGLAFEIPKDHVMLIFSRSGHGFNHGIRLANSVGIIDSDYRGEVAIKLQNDGEKDFQVKKGDRIAQAMVLPVCQVSFELAGDLSETKRGDAGFGSTGR